MLFKGEDYLDCQIGIAVHTSYPSSWEAEEGVPTVQIHPLLWTNVEAMNEYVRLCIKDNDKQNTLYKTGREF